MAITQETPIKCDNPAKRRIFPAGFRPPAFPPAGSHETHNRPRPFHPIPHKRVRHASMIIGKPSAMPCGVPLYTDTAGGKNKKGLHGSRSNRPKKLSTGNESYSHPLIFSTIFSTTLPTTVYMPFSPVPPTINPSCLIYRIPYNNIYAYYTIAYITLYIVCYVYKSQYTSEYTICVYAQVLPDLSETGEYIG